MSGDADTDSRATGQRSLAEAGATHPLWPALTRGCPDTDVGGEPAPLEVTYDYGAVDRSLFDRPPADGLERWAPLLPPLVEGGSLGEGNTPLVATPSAADWAGVDAAVHLKDESQNPTWSQKDRLARLVVGAAARSDAAGVVVSSTGNHGAAVAAYAARHDLPCVVVTSPKTPAAVVRFIERYGGTVLGVEGDEARLECVDRLAGEHGYHAASSRTAAHTGHPFGPEGYKTVAYELHADLGAVPGTVFVPTCYGELIYGVWRGFRELEALGVAGDTPRMVACEPASRASLAAAVESGDPHASVEAGATAAYSIRTARATVRALRAVEESDGYVAPFAEGTLAAAEDELAGTGLWQEHSGAAGVAGLRAAVEDGRGVEGPVVCVGTSSGFKNGETAEPPLVGDDWPAVRDALADAGLPLDGD
jgi:threonine synthase